MLLDLRFFVFQQTFFYVFKYTQKMAPGLSLREATKKKKYNKKYNKSQIKSADSLVEK